MDNRKLEAAAREEKREYFVSGAGITRTRLESTMRTTGVNALRSALRPRQRILQPRLNNWAMPGRFPP